MTDKYDKDRGRLSSESKPKWAKPLVTPLTLKTLLMIGPWAARFLRLVIELVKVLKE